MQALQRVMEQVTTRLKDLGPSSKLLIGCLAIIVVMGLFIVGLYSGRSDLVPLPVQLTAQSKGTVTGYLNQWGIEWVDRGGQIMVPAEQQHVLLAQLTEQDLISPEDINFDSLVQQESPFLSKAQNDRRWLIATMNHLSRTISRMKGVARADVVIDEPARPGGIGAARLRPSASVNIVTRAPLGQAQVNAIAAMVAGAHAELRAVDVAVIDASAGRVHRATAEEDAAAGLYLDLQQKHTRFYELKLLQALSYIPHVNVAVNVMVDHREVVEQSRRMDEPKQAVTEESSRTISSTNRPGGGEPGVRSNQGVALSGGGRSSTLSDERADTKLQPVLGGTDSQIRDPGGYAMKVNASIGVPRSHFVRLFQDQAGDPAAEPTAAELDTIAQAEIPKIRAHIQPLVDTGPKNGVVDGTVAVSMIPDLPMAGGGGDGAGDAVGGAGAGLLSESLVKYTSLGGLALLSVVMMLMMVRKAAVPPPLPTADELEGEPPALDADFDIIGEASDSVVPMEGVEVDESDVRRSQMLGQIDEMSSASPDDAVKILRRWVRETEG